ncbi:MAG: chromate transporter [Chloroflexi bacterium]|nr:chromate transporter [Chloroflexota bacterium]
MVKRGPVREVILLFLKLGVIGFGGPAAHIAMMRQETVGRRRWLGEQVFLDLLGAASLIPGPSSTELGMYLGYKRAGWRGLIAAGVCFIAPAMVIVLAIAWLYVQYGRTSAGEQLLYGIKPAVVAIVVQALWSLGRTAVKARWYLAVGLLAAVLYVLGAMPLALLAGGGIAVGLVALVQRGDLPPGASRLAAIGPMSAAWLRSRLPRGASYAAGQAPLAPGSRHARLPTLAARLVSRGATSGGPLSARLQAAVVPSMLAAAAPSVDLLRLFLEFLKFGAIVFGSGYVLLAFLRGDLVTDLHWLTDQQLLDAVAVGQFTPGPVFTTATFIGYVVAGFPGAILATAGIFLPGFLFVPLIDLGMSRIQGSTLARAFLDGVNVAALGLMAGVTYQLARAAIVDPLTAAILVVAAVAVFRLRLNAAWLVAGGGAVGLLHMALAH